MRYTLILRPQDQLCLGRLVELTGAANRSEAVRRAIREHLRLELDRRAADADAAQRGAFEVSP